MFGLRPPVEDFDALVAALTRPTALVELALLALCLALAWAVVRLARGAQPTPGSIWYGERIVDGVLFPLAALALVLAARWGLRELLPLAVFKIAVPVIASLVVIRIGVRVLRVAFPQSKVVRVIERSLSWLVWIVLVLWATGLLPSLLAEMDALKWTIGGTPVSLRALIEGALSAGIVLLLALWLSAAIEARLLAPGAGTHLSLRKIAANLVRAGLLLVGLLLALSAAGIPLGALSVFGGALGVGIGFGLQKLAANYVSGFVILAERSLRIGDMVRVDNFEGRITDISTRYTVVRSLGGRESIVPNEMLITQRVENLSLADPKVLLQTTVQVPYGSDVQMLIDELTAVVRRVPRVLDDPGPNVQLSAFAADGLELTTNFWIGDPENGQGNARSDVNLALLRRLTELGIEIPFPQRVLHRAPRASAAADDAQPPKPPAAR
jgi:small-conductance mechanosensitive channel